MTNVKTKRVYDKRESSRKYKVGDNVLLLPTRRNKVLVKRRGPYEIINVVNRIEYRINVDGICRTYHANMPKQYIERQDDSTHFLFNMVGRNTEIENDDIDVEDMTFPANE